LGSCSNIPSSYIEKYNSYKDIIETNVRSADLNSYGINGNALIAAIISQESSWNEKATGDNGNSYGLMQINLPAHTECNAASLKAFDVNDNIYCGAKFLQTLINSHYNKPAETYTCKDTQYSGLQAVLRYYNGWNTDCTKGDVNYVDSVYSNYLNWKACFDKATGVVSTTPTPAEPALGDANYCKWRKDSILDLCKEGEGQCSDSNQCNKNTPIVEGEKSYNLECRDPGIGKNICCYEKLEAHTIEESNTMCKNAIKR
jgi:hypothetical protein